jgi:excisionase family DNA binding protein
MAITDRLLTVEQAAKRLKVNPETIRRAIRAGKLPAIKDTLHAGSPFLISAPDLDAFAASRRI